MAKRPDATYETIEMHDYQAALAARLRAHLATNPTDGEVYAPPGYGKTRVVGSALRGLKPDLDAEQPKTHLALWVTQHNSLARTHASEMGAHFNVKKKHFEATATRHSTVLIALSHAQFGKLISPANLHGTLGFLRRDISHLTVVFDESQTIYGRSGAIIKRAMSMPVQVDSKTTPGPGWVARFREACPHVCLLSVTATDALDGAPAKLVEQRAALFGPSPTRLEPTPPELEAHATQLTRFPSLGKRVDRLVDMKSSMASAATKADMSKLVLGRLLFGSGRRTPPFRALAGDAAVTVQAVSDDGMTVDVRYEDGRADATLPAKEVRSLAVSKLLANRAITNLAYEWFIDDLVYSKKTKNTLGVCFKFASLAATFNEEAVSIRDHAIVFLNNERAIRYLVNKLADSWVDNSGATHKSRYLCYVLTADDTKNAQLLEAAQSAIREESDKVVLVFAHSSMRQGVNVFAPSPPAQVCILGVESPTTLTQIEGRFGRFTDEIEVPVVQGGKIACTYFESEVVGKALQLPSDKSRIEQLKMCNATELRAMLGEHAPVDGATAKKDLILRIIELEEEPPLTGRASSRKKTRTAEEDPLKALDVIYRTELEAAETRKQQLNSSASADDHKTADAEVEVAQAHLARLAHHRNFLRHHPLVAMEHVKDLYVACYQDDERMRAFQVEYFALVQQKLEKLSMPTASDDEEEEEAAEEEADELEEPADDMTLQAALVAHASA